MKKTFLRKKNFLLIFFYLLVVVIFYNYFLSFQFNKNQIIDFFISNKEQLDSYIQNNPYKLTLIFFIFSIIWTICLGFGLPTMMVAAYLFDPINATLILVISKSIGVSFVYFFYNKIFITNFINYFDFDKLNKKKISKLFKKNELYYLILFRLFPGVPVQVVDVFPLFIGVKFNNYILSKFIGSLLPHYLIINFFYEFYVNLEKNLATNINLSVTKELLIAFLIFSLFIVISNLVNKKLKLKK